MLRDLYACVTELLRLQERLADVCMILMGTAG